MGLGWGIVWLEMERQGTSHPPECQFVVMGLVMGFLMDHGALDYGL